MDYHEVKGEYAVIGDFPVVNEDGTYQVTELEQAECPVSPGKSAPTERDTEQGNDVLNTPPMVSSATEHQETIEIRHSRRRLGWNLQLSKTRMRPRGS